MTTSILTYGRVTWTNITHPTDEDILQLARRYPQFHPLNLKDCMTELEFPKIDHHDDYLFLVVQFPYWDTTEKISRPAEIDIFVAKGILVTSHRNELKPLNELFSAAQADESIRAEIMENGASPLLHNLLNRLVDYCFPILVKVDHQIQRIEEQLFRRDTRSILNDIALIRRDVIALRRILHPQREVINKLKSGRWLFIHEELDLYWGDLVDHLSQLCAMLDEHSEVILGLSDTIDTLASHRIDEVIRLLTMVTILTLPITLLATIFGMNIVMPFADHPVLFFSILGIGIFLTISIVYYLRKHRML